jgi:WD40 repeat protein
MNRFAIPALSSLLLVTTVWAPMSVAATEADKVAAIQKGLAYLHSTQQSGGPWTPSENEHAATGAASFAFLSQQDKWGIRSAEYQSGLDKAIAYLLSTANVVDVSTRKDGVNVCRGGTGACKGAYWFGRSSTLTTGIVAPAIAAYAKQQGLNTVATTTGEFAGMTWVEVVQAITNALAASQTTLVNGSGGWPADVGSNGQPESVSTHYAVQALIYNEWAGATTPSVVRDDLKTWLITLQAPSGSACSQSDKQQCGSADTGGWILAMKFVGYDATSSEVQAALKFVDNSWQAAAAKGPQANFGHPHAMWAVYEGLEATIGFTDATHVTNLLTHCNGTTAAISESRSALNVCTWSQDYAQWIMNNQKEDGSWDGFGIWGQVFATAAYLNILGAAHIPLNPEQRSISANQTPSRGSPQSPATAVRQIMSAAAVPSAQPVPPAANAKKVRVRVSKGVTSVAVSSDGSSFAGASSDNRIRFWDATTFQQTSILPGTAGLPTDLTFTNGNAILASVGRDSFIRLWDVVNGRELAELTGHEQAINAVAASANGRFLATAGEDTRVMLWDQSGRKLNRVISGPTDFVNALSFSPDSRLLASAGDDARILLIDPLTGKTLFTLRGHADAIDTVVFSPDGTVLASAGQDTVIHLWDPSKGVQRQTLSGHSAPIRAISFSPDGSLLASSGEDTRIIIWNVANGTINKILPASASAINVLAFSPRGPFLISGSEAGEITMWNTAAGIKLSTITIPGL